MNDLMDGQLRDEMGRRARVLAEKFSPEKNVQEMLGIYQEIVRAG
jgi:hypothetical protein